MRIQKGLAEVRERLARARQELRIAEEQELYLSELLEDAKTRALVSETPLADREYQEARGDYERAVRVKEQVNEAIRELEAEQDRLLDRMLG